MRNRLQAVIAICFFATAILAAQTAPSEPPVSPRTWDARALADWATPLASTNTRPGFFSEEEYYRAPVDNYRTYPVYIPGREPQGYWEALKKKKPEPLVDIRQTGPAFDWVAAGKRVWDEADSIYLRLFDADFIATARSAKYVRDNERHLVFQPDGTLAMYRWVVTPRGIALGITACSSCHTRILDDGTTISGAGLRRVITDGSVALNKEA